MRAYRHIEQGSPFDHGYLIDSIRIKYERIQKGVLRYK